jgi:hypothetical protein
MAVGRALLQSVHRATLNFVYLQLESDMPVLEPSPKIAASAVARSASPRVLAINTHQDDRRWQLAHRIARSGGFGRSRLLADFLMYIVDRHIRDRSDEITEQQIGILVFGRAEGYDASDDNIVRSYARTLRRRIDEYFATEGKSESLRLEIPRGGYSPAFSVQTSETEASADNSSSGQTIPAPAGNETDSSVIAALDHTVDDVKPPADAPYGPDAVATTRWPDVGRAALRKFGVPLALALGIVVGLAAEIFPPIHFLKHAFASPAEAASTTLWSELFGADRDTFVVPSDDGLVIMQRLVKRPVALESYLNGSYRTDVKTDGDPGAPEILKLGARRYTSVVDLGFVARLAQLDGVVPSRMVVRYARDLRMDDLRTENAILIGSVEANPWIELFEPQMNFRFEINAGSDKPSGILNMRPRPGESTIYGTPGRDHTYGLIAYVPNLTSTGHVLIVGGLNTAGTEAATTFLLTPSLMMPILQHAKVAHGGLQPFELLIGAGNVATNASAPRLVLERVGPP